ncbi:MAG: GNAT family N-acetyltransferase [Steroidobacteraceae bacterium]
MSGSVAIRPIVATTPSLDRLIALSDAYAGELYPAESNHLESVQALIGPSSFLFGAWIGEQLVGCGGAKILHDDGDYGEIKRVFVLDEHRGKGISKAIMQALEAGLLQRGIPRARLETGIHQPEALGLYRRLGYVERAPFGAYRPDPLSLFMEKALPPA